MPRVVFPSEESAPARSSSVYDQDLKWLMFSNDDTAQIYYNFLKSRSSSRTALVCCFLVTFYVLFINGAAGYNSLTSEEAVVFAVRKARIIVCVLLGIHAYYIRKDCDVVATSKFWDLRNLVVSGNSIIVVNSLFGGLLLVMQCRVRCTTGSSTFLCNKYYEMHELPWINVTVNVLALMSLPSIIKIHSTMALVVSWILNIVSIAIACYIIKGAGSFIVLFLLFLFLGFFLYDTKRGTFDMFFALQQKEQYYKDMLVQEQSKIAIEFEKKQLQDMIGNVAHDLKTPLQAFMSELSGLQREVQGMSNQLRDMEILVSCDDDCTKYELAQGMLAHVNKLTSSALEANKCLASLGDIYTFMMMAINRAIEFRKSASGIRLLPVFETLNLTESVQWAVAMCTNNPTGVEVTLENHSNCFICPTVISDKHWLAENILCLTSNACKFTPAGSITIRCSIVLGNGTIKSSESQSVVSIRNADEIFSPVDFATTNSAVSKLILIEVEDSGIGIPPDKRHCLFHPFGQAQQRAGGTGLGLYSLSKRMEAIEGRCGMCSRRDGSHGSRFWFSIPYVPDASSSTSKKTFKIKPFPSSDTSARMYCDVKLCETRYYGEVLLVDDSALILKTTKRMLEKEGYEVKVAQNGAESLALMKQNHYQFVLTDIQMPLMDGLEATRRIREHEAACQEDGVSFPSQCIIGMSADSSVETKNQAMSCGMNSFLPKPVHVSKLNHILAEMAEEKC